MLTLKIEIDENTVALLTQAELDSLARNPRHRNESDARGVTRTLSAEGRALIKAERGKRRRTAQDRGKVERAIELRPVHPAGVDLAHTIRHEVRAMSIVPGAADTWRTIYACSLLARLAPSCKRVAEYACNGPDVDRLPPKQADSVRAASDARFAKIDARIDRRIAALAPIFRDFGFTIQRQGDPRGHTLRLVSLTGREFGVGGS